jgi:cation:H+ antiporter
MAAPKHIEVHPRSLRVPLIAMFLCGGILLVCTLDLAVTRAQGVLLIVIGSVYFVFDFFRHQRHPAPGETEEARRLESEITADQPWLRSPSGTALQFLVGAAIVIVGSKLLVDAAVSLAGRFGIPSIIIGLTVVAIGTSLPELITAITSSRQNVTDLAVGNILGANIANLTFIVGTASAVNEVSLSRFTQCFNFPALLLLMAVLVVMILSGRRVSRREGVTLLCLYGGYIAALVIFTSMGIR